MKTKKNIKSLLVIFVAMFLALTVYLVYIANTYGTRWFSSPYNTRVQNRRDDVIAGKIYDRNGIVLAYTDDDGERAYNDNKKVRVATAHIVGDEYGQTIGAESLYTKYLLGFDRDFYDVFGETSDGKQHGSDIYLTIDAELCKSAYEQLEYNGVNGAIVMMNYKTGEILISVSRPSFDVTYMAEYLSGEMEMQDSAMVNRVTMGRYTPGSVFKIVTTVAALRYIEGVQDIEFDCDNGLYFNAKTGEWLKDCDVSTLTYKYSTLVDYQHTNHGKLSMREAFIHSCNTSYAQLAMLIGSKNLYRTAKTLGINCEFMFSDIVAYSSSYEQTDNDYDLAWSGVGQSTDIVTPLNMCMISSAVANDGYMQEPKLLKLAKTSSEKISYVMESRIYQSSMSENEADILRDYMVAVVESGTGTKAQIEDYEVGGKTGTAEVTVNGENKSHAWFTGFVYNDEYPLAICVVLEYGGSGGNAAAPIAKSLFVETIGKISKE